MKKLLLVLAAAAAPAWACEPEFDECGLYSGTCQRFNLKTCKLQKLGDVADSADCAAFAYEKPDKFATKWCPVQSDDEDQDQPGLHKVRAKPKTGRTDGGPLLEARCAPSDADARPQEAG